MSEIDFCFYMHPQKGYNLLRLKVTYTNGTMNLYKYKILKNNTFNFEVMINAFDNIPFTLSSTNCITCNSELLMGNTKTKKIEDNKYTGFTIKINRISDLTPPTIVNINLESPQQLGQKILMEYSGSLDNYILIFEFGKKINWIPYTKKLDTNLISFRITNRAIGELYFANINVLNPTYSNKIIYSIV